MERAGIAPCYRLDYPSHFSKPRYTPKYRYSGPPQPGPAILRFCSVTPDHGTVTPVRTHGRTRKATFNMSKRHGSVHGQTVQSTQI
ncbi:hypothetical protein K474DRAFT_1663297 [Panus rudis PR-1116 ss-1]|nr:hypothetical protein K474DRAFT_1663297 [Panus rudis PR-1116 ss-1]